MWSSWPCRSAAHQLLLLLLAPVPGADSSVSTRATVDSASGAHPAPPPPSSEPPQRPASHPLAAAGAPALSTIDELPIIEAAAAAVAAPHTRASTVPRLESDLSVAVAAELEVEEHDSPIDYDRVFCASTNPEYAEYRHAWRQAQDDYHSPATPRSLLASPKLEAVASVPTTALELLVRRSSRSCSGRSTPGTGRYGGDLRASTVATAAAVPPPLDLGVLVLPPSVEDAAARANAVAAERHAELRTGTQQQQAAAGAIDWSSLYASLLPLSENPPTA